MIGEGVKLAKLVKIGKKSGSLDMNESCEDWTK